MKKGNLAIVIVAFVLLAIIGVLTFLVYQDKTEINNLNANLFVNSSSASSE